MSSTRGLQKFPSGSSASEQTWFNVAMSLSTTSISASADMCDLLELEFELLELPELAFCFFFSCLSDSPYSASLSLSPLEAEEADVCCVPEDDADGDNELSQMAFVDTTVVISPWASLSMAAAASLFFRGGRSPPMGCTSKPKLNLALLDERPSSPQTALQSITHYNEWRLNAALDLRFWFASFIRRALRYTALNVSPLGRNLKTLASPLL